MKNVMCLACASWKFGSDHLNMQTGVPLWTVVLCNDFSRGEIAQDRRLLVRNHINTMIINITTSCLEIN